MGERKGTNKYYPPDYDPSKGGLNKFLGTHALRERARKLHLGILIIRFELPYNIWCDGCGNHIGMGVRYNAEKTKVGMYYSTPVYQFRMKCHLCDSHFEIKTDPGNMDYIIVSGARRQENRWDPTENGQVVPDDKRVGKQLSTDAMFKLAHGSQDKGKMKDVNPTLGRLEELQERWKDDYTANKILRNKFRAKKKELKAQDDKDREFLKKSSLEIPLLGETEDDKYVASLLALNPSQSSEDKQKEIRLKIDQKSHFPSNALTLLDDLEAIKLKKEKQRSSFGISVTSKKTTSFTRSSSSSSASSPFSSSSFASPEPNHSNSDTDMVDSPNLNNASKESVNNSSTSSKNVHSGINDSITTNSMRGSLSLISGDYGSSTDSGSD